MTQPTGGLRKRLIRESLYQMVYESLAVLGWFDSGRQHSPVTFNSEPIDPQDSVPLNTIALADENESDDVIELGSLLSEHRWIFYIDVFAEKDSLGLHLSGDIKDILEGRMASVGRTDPSFVVFDYTQSTPSLLFYCEIENVGRDKAHNWNKPHLKHWYSCVLNVVDFYGDESG